MSGSPVREDRSVGPERLTTAFIFDTFEALHVGTVAAGGEQGVARQNPLLRSSASEQSHAAKGARCGSSVCEWVWCGVRWRILARTWRGNSPGGVNPNFYISEDFLPCDNYLKGKSSARLRAVPLRWRALGGRCVGILRKRAALEEGAAQLQEIFREAKRTYFESSSIFTQIVVYDPARDTNRGAVSLHGERFRASAI